MLTAPMVLLETTQQAQDIAASAGPSSIWRGYARVKQYVKDADMHFLGDIRMPFKQPFQVASEKTGLPWTVTNRVYLGQLAGCNLLCPYCYAGHRDADFKPQTVEVTPQRYVTDFWDYNDAYPGAAAGVLRFSGGEPMLYQEWVCEAVERGVHSGAYCWVDTNLTVPIAEEVVDDCLGAFDCIGVCGCFKPGVEGVDLGEQLKIAEFLVDYDVDLYLYYPNWGGGKNELELVFDGLRAIHPNLPLRVEIIGIQGYSTMTDWKPELVDPNRRATWAAMLQKEYPPSMLRLPSNQVAI